jgi:hypothetical protein
MLVAPLAREQWLHDGTAAVQSSAVVPVGAGAQVVPPRVGDTDVVIVGGPEGVQVVRRERRKPVLSGGFGR